MEAVDAHHIDTRLGQLKRGGGAHGAQTDDNYFTVFHEQRSLKKALVDSICSHVTKNLRVYGYFLMLCYCLVARNQTRNGGTLHRLLDI